MRHISIRAAKDSTEVDIFGQIGESFFDEGNTLESVRAEIEGIKTPLIFNVASLGGDVFEGLAIHDLIASHKQDTTVNIIGATASAGAVIAVAGDTVNISENSLFLVHNSHTVAVGNAKDLEDVVDNLNKVDARMRSIFINATGMDETELIELLNEDRFMDAEEALDKGFVDAISKPMKIAASIDMDKVMASKLSVKLKEQLKSNQNKDEMELSAESKGWLTETIEGIVAKFKTEENKDVTVVLADEADITAKFVEFEHDANVADETIEALQVTIKELQAKVASKDAPELEIEASTDPELEVEKKAEESNPWAEVGAQIAASMPAGI